jgi:hypothetical protein
MAKTKSLSLSSTYQDITVQTVCKTVMVKEAESVANYPTVNLKYRGSSADDDEELTAGKPKYITKPDGVYWQVGEKAGQIGVTTGSTSGVQYEE